MLYPQVEIKDAYQMIVSLRLVKSKAEVNELKEAIKTTNLGIMAVMAKAREDLYEYQLADEFLKVVNDDSGYQGFHS
jgi:Xaa-Pro aminopeptidase